MTPNALPWLASLALVLPWLTPVAGGPSANVQPWLFCAFCTCAFALLCPGKLPLRVAAALGAGVAWAWARSTPSLDTFALAGGALLIVLAAAGARTLREDATSLIARAWVVAALVSTAIALTQYFGVAHWWGPLASASSEAEAYGNLRQRNQFASLTVIGIASCLWFVWQGRQQAVSNAAAVLLAIGNAATTSRTGLLELFTLALLAALWGGPQRRDAVRLMAAALFAYGVAALALPALQALAGVQSAASLWDRVASVEACSSRGVLWSNVWQVLAQEPWFGWGWGELDYAHLATLYEGARFCDILDHAHNLPLHLAVELGLPFAALACAFVAGWVLRARVHREANASRRLAWAVLAVIAVHSMLEYPLWYGPFQLALGLSIGLLLSAGEPSKVSVLWTRAAALALAAFTAYAAVDYHRISQIYLPPDERSPAMREHTQQKIQGSWLFENHAAFADLSLTPLTRENASWSHLQAKRLLHYTPEPRLLERVIESATMLGLESEALWHAQRYKTAFPKAYEAWAARVQGTAD